MNIWIDDAPVIHVPVFRWFQGSVIVSRLEGFSIIHDWPIKVEPMYRPLVILEKRQGYLRLELASKVRGLRFLFRRRKPFIIMEALRYENSVYMLGDTVQPRRQGDLPGLRSK